MRTYWFWNGRTNDTLSHPCQNDQEALAHFSGQIGINLSLKNPQDVVAPHMMVWRDHDDAMFAPRSEQFDIPVYEVVA